MLSLGHLCRVSRTSLLPKLRSVNAQSLTVNSQLIRGYSNDVRSGISRHLERRSAKSKPGIMEKPTSGAPFAIGQGAVAGAAALGIGALAFYGLGIGFGEIFSDLSALSFMYNGCNVTLFDGCLLKPFRYDNLALTSD